MCERLEVKALKEEARLLHNLTGLSQSEAEGGAIVSDLPKQHSDGNIHSISIPIELIFGPARRHAT